MPASGTGKHQLAGKMTQYKKQQAAKTLQRAGRSYLARKKMPNNKKKKLTLQTGLLPFNENAYWRLPYAEEFDISSSGTTKLANIGYVYNTMSCYDPRYNTGGGQAIQYDRVSINYERYWVSKVDYEVTFTNPREDGCMLGVRVRGLLNTVTTQGRTTYELMEMENVKYSWMSNTGEQRKTFKGSIVNRKILGLTTEQYGNLEYSGLTQSSSPAVAVFLEPFLQNSASDCIITCYVKLIYHIHMTNFIDSLDA